MHGSVDALPHVESLNLKHADGLHGPLAASLYHSVNMLMMHWSPCHRQGFLVAMCKLEVVAYLHCCGLSRLLHGLPAWWWARDTTLLPCLCTALCRMQGAGWSNTSLITTAMLSQHFDLDAGWQAQVRVLRLLNDVTLHVVPVGTSVSAAIDKSLVALL